MVYAGSVGYVVNESVGDRVRGAGRWVKDKAKKGYRGAKKYGGKGLDLVGTGVEKVSSAIGHVPGAIGGAIDHIPGLRRIPRGFKRGAKHAYDYVS